MSVIPLHLLVTTCLKFNSFYLLPFAFLMLALKNILYTFSLAFLWISVVETIEQRRYKNAKEVSDVFSPRTFNVQLKAT